MSAHEVSRFLQFFMYEWCKTEWYSNACVYASKEYKKIDRTSFLEWKRKKAKDGREKRRKKRWIMPSIPRGYQALSILLPLGESRDPYAKLPEGLGVDVGGSVRSKPNRLLNQLEVNQVYPGSQPAKVVHPEVTVVRSVQVDAAEGVAQPCGLTFPRPLRIQKKLMVLRVPP